MKNKENSFDYEEFAKFAKQESETFLPENLSIEKREFVLNSFEQFALKTGKVLSLDSTLALDNDQKILKRAKYILEWIFKTSVALVESDIPQECWQGFILDIGYIAFEISKNLTSAITISDEQIEATIELQVVNKIKILLQNLQENYFVTSETIEKFWKHPYMDKSVKNIEFSIYGEDK